MGIKNLLRALAALLSLVSLFMALCLAAGLAMGEAREAWRAFGLPLLLGLVFPIFLAATGRRRERISLSPRYSYLFVSLAWISASLLGALPFVLSGALPSFADACFETMSGLTTTGATVIADIEALPRCLLLWRATTHWLGGMGIVVLTVAVLPLLGIGGRALVEAESPGPQVEKFTPRLSETAKILWLLYLGLTLALVILLRVGGMDWVDSVCHAFATMATGGFSTRNASVAAYGSPYLEAVITLFMVMAGVNFSLYWRLLRGDLRTIAKDSEFRSYAAIFVAATAIVAIDLYRRGHSPTPLSALRYASFQAASILTTTGFTSADYLQWPALSQAVLFALMFIGGCSGSTAGGPKVGRIVALFKMGFAEMRYLLKPHGIYGVFVDGRYLKKEIVYDIAAMVFLYIVAVIVSTLVLATAGFDLLTGLSATMASLGNIGPGFSLVGPMFNYGFFPDYVKAWLAFVMLLGRLEIFTVLVLFTRSFWKR